MAKTGGPGDQARARGQGVLLKVSNGWYGHRAMAQMYRARPAVATFSRTLAWTCKKSAGKTTVATAAMPLTAMPSLATPASRTNTLRHWDGGFNRIQHTGELSNVEG